MQISEIIDIITGKKSINKDDLSKINELIEKYPYFETAYNISLRYYYAELPTEFDKKLSEYSIFISNRKKLVDETFFKQIKPVAKKVETKSTVKTETQQSKTVTREKKVVKKREKKPSKLDQIIFDPELYERQKVWHKNVTEDFIVPKAHGYGELRKLLKQENVTEEEFWQSLKDDNVKNNAPNVNAVKNEKKDVKKERPKQGVDRNKTTKEEDLQKKVEEKVVEDKTAKKDVTQKNTEEKVVEDKTVKKGETKKQVEETTTNNNDIFSRIAKLKAQKLIEVENKEENQPEVKEEQIADDKKTDVIQVENKDENQPEVKEEQIADDKKTDVTEVENKEEKKSENEDSDVEKKNITKKDSKIVNSIELIDESKDDINDVKLESENKIETEQEKEISVADKVLLKLKNKSKKTYSDGDLSDKSKKDVTAEDVLKKLNSKKEKSILSEDVEINNDITEEEPKVIEVVTDEIKKEKEVQEKSEDTIENKKEVINEAEKQENDIVEEEKDTIENKKEVINEAEKQENDVVEEEKDTDKVEVEEKKEASKVDADKKKSAADIILERINNRKKNKEGDLVSKFLTEQPRIDVKKEPEIKEDLSLKSVKETEVITERIAEIYALQGLKEKAINVYEKLILKYPEKNTYFASKIEELKNK